MSTFLFEEDTEISINEFVETGIVASLPSPADKKNITVLTQEMTPVHIKGSGLGRVDNLIRSRATHNLTGLLLSGCEKGWAEEWFADLIDYEERYPGALRYIENLINQINGTDFLSIRALVDLTTFQNDAWRYRSISEKGTTLPDEKGCETLRVLAEHVIQVINKYGAVPVWGDEFEDGYNKVVKNGVPDYVSDDAIWMIQTNGGYPDVYIWRYLLVSYLIIKNSRRYKNKPLRYLNCINPVQGVIYQVDVNHVDPDILREINKAYHGK